ncbi:AAA family ATPase [Demequina sp. SO4-13]|uniref:AAA family ATPase n=1 Tax=Demequina sp. SO4-13 TaxID=3401027 RepID=UPI003AF71AD8
MSPKPFALVMTGAPASGKSTTAAELARRMGAALLDQDSMTNPLVDVVAGVLGTSDYGDPQLAALTREARYACLLRVASDCLRSGVPVIMIAPFTTERHDPDAWDRLASQLAEAGGRVGLVWIRIESALLVDRLVARAAPRDQGKIDDLPRYVASLDLDPPRAPHIEVDGSLSANDQATRILESLSVRAE